MGKLKTGYLLHEKNKLDSLIFFILVILPLYKLNLEPVGEVPLIRLEFKYQQLSREIMSSKLEQNRLHFLSLFFFILSVCFSHNIEILHFHWEGVLIYSREAHWEWEYTWSTTPLKIADTLNAKRSHQCWKSKIKRLHQLKYTMPERFRRFKIVFSAFYISAYRPG